jgi:hypothetical protein
MDPLDHIVAALAAIPEDELQALRTTPDGTSPAVH